MPFHGALGASGCSLFSLSLFHDQLGTECKNAAPAAHPTPVTGRSAVAGGKVPGASLSPQDRNLWRLENRDESHRGNMSNCRFGRIVTMTSLAELADAKLPPAGIYYAVSSPSAEQRSLPTWGCATEPLRLSWSSLFLGQQVEEVIGGSGY